jgi:hypothetical protein
MIDSVLNVLFRCSHRCITRPMRPVQKREPHGGTYVVCWDCGKEFEYDTTGMRRGKPIDRSESVGVLPPTLPKAPQEDAYTLLAAVPSGLMLGAVLKGRNKATSSDARTLGATPARGVGPIEKDRLVAVWTDCHSPASRAATPTRR